MPMPANVAPLPTLAPAVTYIVGRGGKLNPGGVFVVERPGLGDFLHRLAAFAEVRMAWCWLGACGAAGLNRQSSSAAELSTVFHDKVAALRPVIDSTPPPVCPPAQVVLFTAGLEDYAAPICDAIEARYPGAFHHRLYRPATVACEAYPCVKVGLNGQEDGEGSWWRGESGRSKTWWMRCSTEVCRRARSPRHLPLPCRT